MKKVRTASELGDALKSDADEIHIEGDLASKTIKIRATGKVAWAVAIGAIAVAVGGLVLAAPSGGTTAVASGLVAPAAVAVLGAPVAATAIAVAIAAGGVGALTSLRKYKEVSRSGGVLVLRRR